MPPASETFICLMQIQLSVSKRVLAAEAALTQLAALHLPNGDWQKRTGGIR
jgi:hypothetical protein